MLKVGSYCDSRMLDWFRGLGAPVGRKSLSPIAWRYHPYNSVRTNVLHCDDIIYVITV